MKAKVFLSCGQNRESEELILAERIVQVVEKVHGFECYMAVAETTFAGLRENIFQQLRTADYFIFIDFKREELKSEQTSSKRGHKTTHRGSLFSNQELAIASFLNVPSPIILRERGVKPRDGMLVAMQSNEEEFSDRNQLPNIVSAKIIEKTKKGEWSDQSRNLLTLEAVEVPVTAIFHGDRRRYFHISVINHHHQKAALNCFVYLDKVVDLRTKVEIPHDTAEIKWAGTNLPSVRIGPNASRKVDAFWISDSAPQKPGFNILSDSAAYFPVVQGSGPFELSYSVVSDTFPPAARMFILDLSTMSETFKGSPQEGAN